MPGCLQVVLVQPQLDCAREPTRVQSRELEDAPDKPHSISRNPQRLLQHKAKRMYCVMELVLGQLPSWHPEEHLLIHTLGHLAAEMLPPQLEDVLAHTRAQ